ncbi:MAG: 3-deoxy-manno-octulosonate cytidylyltransferase [Parachlamydiaceae bacterium]
MSKRKENAIGIIPARFQSSRFPGKPLALISGISLIRRVYENAKKCVALDEVVVATDDERILKHVKGFGGHAVLTSTHCESGTDRLAEACAHHEICQGYPIVVNVQGDEPCLPLEAIEKVVEMLHRDPEAVCATTIAHLTSEIDAMNSSVVKVVKDIHDNALYFSRSLIPGNQSRHFNASVEYFRHMGLYGYRAEFLQTYGKLPATPLQLAESLEQLKVLENGYKMKVALVDRQSIDVNHPEDIQKVEKYIWEQNSSL